MKRNKNFQVDKRWIYQEGQKSKISLPGISPQILDLLVERGLTNEKEILDFLYPDYHNLSKPTELNGIKDAVAVILEATRRKEKIVIYGDYDVDGVSAIAILARFFNLIKVEVETYIPSREGEGYGLNKLAVRNIAKKGTKLLITVDCGTNSTEEVKLCHKLGLKVVITDHHQMSDISYLPDALVNPQAQPGQQFSNLCGAGVAFFLVRALQEHFMAQLPKGQEKWFLDLVALGTICDIVPLTGDNRIIAKYGIMVMSKSRNIGLAELAAVAGFDLATVDTYKIGFSLGPRLNAAGRMENAHESLGLLLTENHDKAVQIAKKLDELNSKRQEITENIINEAREIIQGLDKERKIYLLSSENWPAGVVGIAAARLVEEYGRPVLIMNDMGTKLKGSARSIKKFNIIQALTECQECLTQFGGHAMAAGFSLDKEKLSILDKKLLKITEDKIQTEDLIPEITIDRRLQSDEVDLSLARQLSLLEPYGAENFKPIFAVCGVKVLKIQLVGNPKIHLKINFIHGKDELSAIAFNYGELCLFEIGDLVDIAFTLELNEWRGQKRVDLHLSDIKMHKIVEQ